MEHFEAKETSQSLSEISILYSTTFFSVCRQELKPFKENEMQFKTHQCKTRSIREPTNQALR